MKLSTELKTHRLIFKDKDEPSILLTSIERDIVEKAWRNKEHFIKIGDSPFSWQDIKTIKQITKEERKKLDDHSSKYYIIDKYIGKKDNKHYFEFTKIRLIDGKIISKWKSYKNPDYKGYPYPNDNKVWVNI